MQAEDKEKLGLALGRIPSGLFIVSFFNHELNQHDGMLMSWIQQTSFEPPMVSVCVQKSRKSLELIQQAGYFVVNIMGKQSNSVIGKFYKGEGEEKFVGTKTKKAETANALILEDAVSYLECKVSGIIETAGDHSIMLGEIISGELLVTENNDPSVHLRKSGFGY
ncbi:MAG: flavin reductase family protein [Candidatus Melainabacteria bacterium]|jgi:flavin reductase (DIM6/NTAB) family NADH-FMN oxidoreductase RutF